MSCPQVPVVQIRNNRYENRLIRILYFHNLYVKSKKKTQVPNCSDSEMPHTGAEVSSIRGPPPPFFANKYFVLDCCTVKLKMNIHCKK